MKKILFVVFVLFSLLSCESDSTIEEVELEYCEQPINIDFGLKKSGTTPIQRVKSKSAKEYSTIIPSTISKLIVTISSSDLKKDAVWEFTRAINVNLKSFEIVSSYPNKEWTCSNGSFVDGKLTLEECPILKGANLKIQAFSPKELSEAQYNSGFGDCVFHDGSMESYGYENNDFESAKDLLYNLMNNQNNEYRDLRRAHSLLYRVYSFEKTVNFPSTNDIQIKMDARNDLFSVLVHKKLSTRYLHLGVDLFVLDNEDAVEPSFYIPGLSGLEDKAYASYSPCNAKCHKDYVTLFQDKSWVVGNDVSNKSLFVYVYAVTKYHRYLETIGMYIMPLSPIIGGSVKLLELNVGPHFCDWNSATLSWQKYSVGKWRSKSSRIIK